MSEPSCERLHTVPDTVDCTPRSFAQPGQRPGVVRLTFSPCLGPVAMCSLLLYRIHPPAVNMSLGMRINRREGICYRFMLRAPATYTFE